MRLFGLIGYPLSHSFSQQYFTGKFAEMRLSGCRYELFPIPAIDELPGIIKEHPDLGGLNVTIPYKEAVLPFLDETDAVVRAVQACNCIRMRGGKLSGFNTDVEGFRRSLQTKLKPHHTRALVLGTGGAAKAVAFVLQELGIASAGVSRKPGTGLFSYDQLDEKMIRDHPLIINTTPVGMYPATDKAPPIPYAALTPAHYLFDLVYNPEKTVFLQRGEEKGAAIKNGYEMLLIQAEESWRIWNE